MAKKLKNEACFASALGIWLSDQLTDNQRAELEQMFSLDYGGLDKACNRYMQRTIKAIRKGLLSADGFTAEDLASFARLLSSEKLDSALQTQLKNELQKRLS